MNPEKTTKIEDLIIKTLKDGPLPSMDLVKKISIQRLRATKQAVYSALRKLKKEEIVVTHGKVASLNSLWINKMSDFFAEARHHYSIANVEAEGFLALEDGDKITYNFKNPETTDAFWGHAFDILANIMGKDEPVFIYNPHQWFLLAREEQETALFKRITAQKRQILITSPGQEALDKFVRKYFDGTYTQYHLLGHELFKKSNYYVNIFGDYLVEVWIDEKTQEKIDGFYKTNSEFTEENKRKIQNIIATQGKNKLSISRDKDKAEKIKKMLKKDFYIIKS